MALPTSQRLLRHLQEHKNDTLAQRALERAQKFQRASKQAQTSMDGLPPSVREELIQRVRWNGFIVLRRGANLEEKWDYPITRSDFPGKLPHGSLIGMHLQLMSMFEKLNDPQVTAQERSALLMQTRNNLGTVLRQIDGVHVNVKQFLSNMAVEYNVKSKGNKLTTTMFAKTDTSAQPQPQPPTYHSGSGASRTSSSCEYSPQYELDSGTIKAEYANVGAPLTHHSAWNDMASQNPPGERSQPVKTTKLALQLKPTYFRKRSYSVESPPATEDYHRYEHQYQGPINGSLHQMNSTAPKYVSSQAIVQNETSHAAKKVRFNGGDKPHGQRRGHLTHQSRPEDPVQPTALSKAGLFMNTSNQSRTIGPSRNRRISVPKRTAVKNARPSWSPFVQSSTQDRPSTQNQGKASTVSARPQNHHIIFRDEDEEPASKPGALVAANYTEEPDDILCLRKKLNWVLAKEESVKLEVQFVEKELQTRIARNSIQSASADTPR